MKTGILMAAAVALAAVVGLASQARPGPAPRGPAPEPRSGAMGDLFDSAEPTPTPLAESAALSGRVLEVIDVAEYSYLRLATAQGEVWAAVSKAAIAVGSEVAVENPTRMENFQSTTLKRSFDVIYFGNLAQAGGRGADALPPGHPSIEGEESSPHAHGGLATDREDAVAEVKVTRAAGGNAHRIVELFDEAQKLEGQLVRVRGQVVKVTPGVMGKTYLRLRDGSATRPEQRELVVTTAAEPRVGDVSTFEGTLRTQVDVGIGYSYPVLLSDAQLLSDPGSAK